MPIKMNQWIAWLGATIVAALTMASFAFTTFETKDHVQETKQDLRLEIREMRMETMQRFDRLESKIDELKTH